MSHFLIILKEKERKAEGFTFISYILYNIQMSHFLKDFIKEVFLFCYFLHMREKKKKIIIIGKAASGKDFLQRQLVLKGYIPLKQYTTRPKRPNESGDEYHFVTEEEFDSIIHKLKSVQNFVGWKYGYDIDEALISDVMIFSPANYFDIINAKDDKSKKLIEQSVIVYLDVGEDVRRERLSNRYVGGYEDDPLERRIRADDEDFKFFDNIDWSDNQDKYIRLCDEEDIDEFLKKLFS